MRIERSAAQEAAEDIFFGQLVIIYARWFVIVAMVVLALWSSNSIGQLTIAILFIVPMMAINFFVHGRYLMEKPVNAMLLLLLSVVDVIIITMIVLFWQDGSGLASQFYIFYYPILLAFAFVFPARNSAIYTIFALVVYATACILATPSAIANSPEMERLVIRLITMASMGVLGIYYWRIQRSRRREELVAEPGSV